jgi:hypothetical protein
MHAVHTFTPYFLKNHSNIIFPCTPNSSKCSSLQVFQLNALCISHLSHACYMPRPSHSHWLVHPDNTWWSVQFIKLFIMHSSSSSRHFLWLRSKYTPQHPVLKYPQSMCFPYRARDQVSHPYPYKTLYGFNAMTIPVNLLFHTCLIIS